MRGENILNGGRCVGREAEVQRGTAADRWTGTHGKVVN